MSGQDSSILVTGATGYLASWIVYRLLYSGYSVHATARSLKNESKIAHLRKLEAEFPDKLSLYEADLLLPGSFDQAMTGCSIVIHTASPYFLEKPKNIDNELIKPALNGTLNVLASVNKIESIKRVVLTSSTATLYNDACDIKAMVQEDDINPNQNANHNPYAYSKTVAENAAWEVEKNQSRWSLVTIHPSAIFGPSLSQRADSTSVKLLIQFLNGSFRMGVPKLWLGVVDVRDVAEAHIKAATLPDANNRYIIVNNCFNLLEISKLIDTKKFSIKNRLPVYEAPNWLLWLLAPLLGLQRNYLTRNLGYPISFNSSRSKIELEMKYYNIVDTFNDHVKQIVNDHLLPNGNFLANKSK